MILREPINGLTHFIGALLSIVALVVLVVYSAIDGSVWHVVSFSIYGTSMFLLYLFSSLYHWLPLKYKGVMKMRKLDHMMIFVMIAGSYTPMCLIPLRDVWGWSLFGTVWGIAITGFFIKIFWLNAPRVLYVSIYIAMGWLVVIAIYPISKVFPTGGIVWLTMGGIFYTFGAVIYAKKRPNPIPHIFGFHEIWHIFVMLGSASHFWMMWKYILPMK